MWANMKPEEGKIKKPNTNFSLHVVNSLYIQWFLTCLLLKILFNSLNFD